MSALYSGQVIYRPRRLSVSKTDPAQEPVWLEEMKDWARIDHTDDDATVSGLIIAARRWVETFTQRALLTQTFTYKTDGFPRLSTDVFELPGGKVSTFTSIVYLDTNGDSQTWSSSKYTTDLVSEPALVGLVYNEGWPSIREWDLPVTLTYDAGFGADPSDVPEELRTSIKIIVAELYENREETVVGTVVSKVPWTARALAEPYRILRII